MTIFDLINRCIMSDTAKCALAECIASKGPRKGMLRARPLPEREHPQAYAAWHGAMLAVNAYKAGIGSFMMMDATQRAIADEVTRALDQLGAVKIAFDKDRLELERLGVW